MSRAPLAPVSWGELLDKIAILQIKLERITSAPARANVSRELECLMEAASEVLDDQGLAPMVEQLRQVNEKLWDIEEAIREKEAAADFGHGFVELARSVYKTNDERAAIKRTINERLGSELVEEKSYADWE